jgi:phosphoribosylformylglycinamidine cyclo-ligase
VEKSKIIDGHDVRVGDALIGVASSGPHSNGYSLIRKIIEVSKADLNQSLGDTTLADALMQPTRIYVKSMLSLIRQSPVHALAHITGGGILENIPRVLPDNTKAVIDAKSWELPPVFQWLQQNGNVNITEMYRTFNCGIGMVICIDESKVELCKKLLTDSGETVFEIGVVEARIESEEQVELLNLQHLEG